MVNEVPTTATEPVPKRRAAILAILVVASFGCAGRAAVPAPAPGTIDPLEQLRRDITTATQLPGVQHGVWGIAVHSLDRNERLYELNASTLLVPASTAKLVAVATAVDAVGWDFRFRTTLSASGLTATVPDLSAIQGDMLVSGRGDPSIGGRGGEDLAVWAQALAARGVRTITGRIIVDDDAVEEPRPALAWAWDDLGYRTGAIFGALNYAENRMWVTVVPANAPGQPARLDVEPIAALRPLVSRVETVPADAEQLLWPEQRPGESWLTIAGTIRVGSAPARLQVSAGNPTLWFAQALKSRLMEAGIVVHGAAVDVDDLPAPPMRSDFSPIHIHWSPPLSALVQPLLKDSINVYAEAVLRLNAAPGGLPTNDAALAGMQSRLAAWGVPAWGQQVVDGSGLSRRNVLTPDTLVRVLARMHDRSGSSPWMTALPVAGVDGSLESRMRGTAAEGRVRAKTGTMTNVRGLAGYAITPGGEHLAFAVLLNNFEGSGAEATAAVDAVAVALAGFRR